jgi:predicted nucleic acid-binding protein
VTPAAAPAQPQTFRALLHCVGAPPLPPVTRDRHPERQRRAAEVLLELARRGGAELPVQALAKFSSVALRRLEPPLKPAEAAREVERLMTAFPVLPLTHAVVLEALRGVAEHGFSTCDAQVWATARLYQVPLLLTDDFSDGAVIEGVRIVNPLIHDAW